MGFGDKLKGLREQAQQAVAENKDKIQGVVQTAAEVANTRTGGKYADKISNVGEKLSTSVDKFADDPAAAGTTASEASAATTGAVTEEPVATTGPVGEEPAAAAAPEAPKAPSAPPEFE